MQREERSDRFTALEDQFSGYQVYDQSGSKIGKVDDLFVDSTDQPEYIGVKTGLLGTSSTLIPMDICTVDESTQSITVNADKQAVSGGPAFDDDGDITPDYENQVRSYYGLGAVEGSNGQGGYDAYYGEETNGEHVADSDELRVQRSEEELRAGTREVEAGALNVRKRVRTDREQVSVPTRHEEVSVERVPVEGEATEAQIGDDEVSVPLVEEEVVVEKRPVVKEELRIRKDVVQDEQVVEEDVRREEVDIDDETTTRRDR